MILYCIVCNGIVLYCIVITCNDIVLYVMVLYCIVITLYFNDIVLYCM